MRGNLKEADYSTYYNFTVTLSRLQIVTWAEASFIDGILEKYWKKNARSKQH